MKTILRNIFYHPVKARITYDLAISFFSAILVWFILSVFSLPAGEFLLVLVYPLAFISVMYLLAVYTKYKTANLWIKALLILIAVLGVSELMYLLGLPLLSIIIISFFVLGLVVLPRVFLNIYGQNDKAKYFSIIVHEKLPILVVGGGGYIGSYVVEKLLESGYKVRLFDKFIYGKEILSDLLENKNLEVIEGDISDIYALTIALNGVQAVVHLAGLVGDPACAIDDQLTRHINIVSTRMLIESVKAFGIPKFIFASSCSVYGATDEQVDEVSDLNPVSLYARTKIDAEREILSTQDDNFNPVILRFATVFGHSRKPRFDLVANLFVAQAYNNGIITVTGSQQWRPFVHVTDLAKAIVRVIKAPTNKVSRQIYNVGDNSLNITIGDLARLVAKVVKKDRNGKKVQILVKDDITDRRNYNVSFTRIEKDLGFSATIGLEEGLKEILEKFKGGFYNRPYIDPYYSNFEMTKEIVKEFHSEAYRRNHFSTLLATSPN